MRHYVFLPILVILAMLSLPSAAGALGLDVEAKAGGGLTAGTTSNPNQTGSPRGGLQGAVDLDLLLLSIGSVDLGISVGAEYSYLTFHGVVSNISAGPLGTTTLTSDSTYNYLNIPVAFVGRVPLSDMLRLTFRAGGFIGYFLGGSSNNTYSPEIPLAGLTNGTTTLNSSTTVQWEYGLHFTGGADIRLNGNLFLSPSIVFDMGLTNTTNSPGYQYSDTFWSLTAMIGIKYGIF